MNRKQRRTEQAQARKAFTITLPDKLTADGEAELRHTAEEMGIKRLRIIVE